MLFPSRDVGASNVGLTRQAKISQQTGMNIQNLKMIWKYYFR